MVEYGSGPRLDRYLDFVVGPTGDVDGVDGVRELEKDIGFFVKAVLKYGYGIETPETVASGGVLGQPLTMGIESDIEQAVEKVILSDGRIQSVDGITIEETDRTDEIRVRVESQTFDDSIELDLIVSA